MSKATKLLCGAACAAALLMPAAGAAQAPDGLEIQAILYGYLPTISGTTTFPPPEGSIITLDPDKILESLKLAFMVDLDVRKGRWGFTSDVMYMNIGNHKSNTRDIEIGGAQIPADVSAKVELNMKAWAWTIAGTYEAVPDPQKRLFFLAGARLLDIEQDLDLRLSGNVGQFPLPDRQGSFSAKLDNWDAVVGLRGRLAFGSNGKWFVPYYADIGAGDSDLTWQAIGGLGYATKWGDVLVAWRYLDYDMKPGSGIQSLNLSGPMIGIGFRW